MASASNRILFILFSTLFIVAAPISPLKTKGESAVCLDLLVLFARGSGQNSGVIDSSYPDSDLRVQEYHSKAFFDEIGKRVKGLSIEYKSLHNFDGKYNQYGYQAVGVVDGFAHRPTHRSDVPNRYYESVADGAEELAWYLEDKMTSCPFQQIILGGYSQGAHVIGDALYKIKPNLRARIGFVALYGDPKFNPRTSTIPIKTGPWASGNVLATQNGILLPRNNYIPDDMYGRVKSWCDFSDPICANFGIFQFTGVNVLIDAFGDRTHNNIYQNKWIPQGANDIVYIAKQTNPILASRVQTTPWINKNDKMYQLDLAVVLDTTGSMSSITNPIKNNLSAFISALFGSYWDTRVGLVTFNDVVPGGGGYPYGTPSYYSKLILDFTTNKDVIKTSLNDLRVGGGGDDAEATYSGLMTAMNNLNWRVGAQKKILLITDAVAKDPDPGPEHWTKAQVKQRALELDPVIISLSALPRAQPWPYTTEVIQQVEDNFANSVKDIAISTNGVITEGARDYRFEYVTNTITKMELAPIALINGDSEGVVGQPVYFSGGDSYDPDSVITQYKWDFNNDGIWDTTTSSPLAEYSYSQSYNGFVVLEVSSADGGSAKAILNMAVSNQNSPTTPVPNTPIASTTVPRVTDSATINWSNAYDSDTVVKITDASGNVLGYAAGNDSFEITDLPAEATMIQLSAGNSAGWSEPVTLTIPAKLLPPPTPQVTFERYINDLVLKVSNSYTLGEVIIVKDKDNNALATQPVGSDITIQNIPLEAFLLLVTATNKAGESQPLQIDIPAQTLKNIPLGESNPAWLLELANQYYANLNKPTAAVNTQSATTPSDTGANAINTDISSSASSQPYTSVAGVENAKPYTSSKPSNIYKQLAIIAITILFLWSSMALIKFKILARQNRV